MPRAPAAHSLGRPRDAAPPVFACGGPPRDAAAPVLACGGPSRDARERERDAVRAGAGPAADDERFMREALEAAREAGRQDEVPIGAVVVLDGRVVARAFNQTRTRRDPTAHAELLAVSAAARELGLMRLEGAVVYTTVEPCFMCAGALSHARVARVVWAVRDPKFGGCVSLGSVLDEPRLNHQVEHAEGVGAEEARSLLQTFFREKRGAR